MNRLRQDLRYAIRMLLKSPGFTVVAVLTLALGIGANSAIFSFVNAVLLKPLPYAEADRIMRVWEKPPGGLRNGISTLNFLDWKDGNNVFDHIAAQTGSPMTLSGIEEPTQIRTGRVSPSYFEIFGIKPAIGRLFAPDEDQEGKDRVVVLSHSLWTTQFGSDPHVVDRKLTLDGEPYTVLGVLPEGSVFDRAVNQMWRPLAFRPQERTRDFHWLTAVARLKPGVTLEQARSAMDAIGARIASDYPDSNKGWGVFVESYADTLNAPGVRQTLYVLLSAVGMLLLIGCANLANLVLARGAAREMEVSIRAAIGAGRGRLMRQFLTENVLLSLAGGITGLALGYAMMAGLKVLIPPFTLPREITVNMDVRVLFFTLVLSIVTGLVFGLAPALHATKPDLARAMKEGGRGTSSDSGRRRLRSALVVTEVALSFMLLVGAGLLLRSFFKVMDVDTGFDSTNVLTANLPVPQSRFADSSQVPAYAREIMARVNAVPAVRESAITSALPMQGWGYGMPFLIAGRDAVGRSNRQGAGFKMVSASYFSTLEMKLIRGRGFTGQDVKGMPPVMVINETMSKRFFANQDPLAQRILVQEIVPGKPQLGPEIAWEIVGVVADETVGALDGTSSPGMYVPFEQSPATFMSLVVRASMDPVNLERSIRSAIHEVNKDQALPDLRTLESIKSDSMAPDRLRAILLVIFAVFAVLLSAIGIYGVISYSVVQRTHEIGIRAAFGASRGTLIGLVLRNGMTLAFAGLLIGAAGAIALTRLLSGLLFGVGARDPMTLIAAGSTLAFVAFLACFIPARRAARLDPLAALRRE